MNWSLVSPAGAGGCQGGEAVGGWPCARRRQAASLGRGQCRHMQARPSQACIQAAGAAASPSALSGIAVLAATTTSSAACTRTAGGPISTSGCPSRSRSGLRSAAGGGAAPAPVPPPPPPPLASHVMAATPSCSASWRASVERQSASRLHSGSSAGYSQRMTWQGGRPCTAGGGGAGRRRASNAGRSTQRTASVEAHACQALALHGVQSSPVSACGKVPRAAAAHLLVRRRHLGTVNVAGAPARAQPPAAGCFWVAAGCAAPHVAIKQAAVQRQQLPVRVA